MTLLQRQLNNFSSCDFKKTTTLTSPLELIMRIKQTERSKESETNNMTDYMSCDLVSLLEINGINKIEIHL